MGLDVLKCKTVDGVLKELIVFALIYNLVRLVMGQAARRQHVDIDRISFIDAAAMAGRRTRRRDPDHPRWSIPIVPIVTNRVSVNGVPNSIP